jgi:hypothetical protein
MGSKIGIGADAATPDKSRTYWLGEILKEFFSS